HNSQPLLAAADFDQALKLKPGDIPSLVARAELRLEANDSAGAFADLDVAQQAASKEADVRFGIGSLYVQAGRFAPGIAEFDLWIPAHPNDSRMPDAYARRGLARAQAGLDFDKALSDANASLRLRPREPQFLSIRAFIELQSGNVDKSIADWNTVLAAQPK